MFPAACSNPVVVDLNHSYLRCAEARGGGDGRGHSALSGCHAVFLHVSTANGCGWVYTERVDISLSWGGATRI